MHGDAAAIRGDRRHAVVDLRDQLVRWHRDDGEG
jgi:hypothetical protein